MLNLNLYIYIYIHFCSNFPSLNLQLEASYSFHIS